LDYTNSRYPTVNLNEHTDMVNSLVFHPKLPFLASASDDNTVILWDCTNPLNPTLIATMHGHTDAVLSVAFHPTRPLLASGSGDATIKIWKL